MFWPTTFPNNITTVIPHGVDPKTVSALLHDHGFVITQSPIVTRFSERERQGRKITYDIWEKVDLLPFGLWKREIQFKASFEDKQDGMTSWIEAPLGLTSQAVYTVRHRTESATGGVANEGADGSETTAWVLEEAVETSVSIFVRPLVEPQLVAARTKIHESIIKRARELGDKGMAGSELQSSTV